MESQYNFKRKAVVVTGATSGIGYQAALEFAVHGAFVIGVGRNKERCAQAETNIRAAYPEAQVCFLLADLSLQSQVRRLAGEILQELQRAGFQSLDVLVNNAGLYSGKYVLTPDGVELTLAVNHIAPFLLTHELLPPLTAASAGRVLTVSSGSHYGAALDIQRLNHPPLYFGLWAYGTSKLANVLFTRELNRRAARTPLRAFAVDPGLVNTQIGSKGAGFLTGLVWKLRSSSGVSPEVPVRTILFLAGDPSVQDSREIYWYDCRSKLPSRQAQREDLARELWRASCQMCGIQEER